MVFICRCARRSCAAATDHHDYELVS